ncbi:MerR family transcriptional regulator [Enterococcus casseliflavus]|jgi:DNA-binding transcriptional MerR regulator|uniref:MerR family transcriptional regulator n=1 Tax=Enterococcus casseliflavus TaxID=37734 RepID=UPI003DA42145
METKHLITIGQLAKISDVHVKALRYYERIGLLPPTYVNPENGYRYFSHTHVYLIEVIRLWTDLQLPLKTLKEFVSTDGVQVELTNLIDFATKAAIEKIAEMKEKVTLLTEIKTEIQRSEEIKKREVVHTLEIPEAHFWLVPYEGKIGDIAYHKKMAAAYDTIVSHQLTPTYECGLISFVDQNKFETYLFIELAKSSVLEEMEQILHLPAATYVTLTTKEQNIQKASTVFSDLLRTSKPRVLFQTELFSEVVNADAFSYEICCSL